MNLRGLAGFGGFALTMLAIVALWNLFSGQRPVLTVLDPIKALFAAAAYSTLMYLQRKKSS